MISGMNHAVLYVRDSERHRRFYEDVLGFSTVINAAGQYAFMRAPGSENHHDIAFFAVGEHSGASQAGRQTVGMYHIAWEVATLAELVEMEQRLRAAGVLVGASDHGVNKSLYCKDPDGLEFEVMWLVPPEQWGDDEHQAIIRPLDLTADTERFAHLATTLPSAGAAGAATPENKQDNVNLSNHYCHFFEEDEFSETDRPGFRRRVITGESLQLCFWRIKGGATGSYLHKHDDNEQLGIIVRGSLDFRIFDGDETGSSSKREVLNANQAYLAAPGVWHGDSIFVGDDEYDECWILDVFSPPRDDLAAG